MDPTQFDELAGRIEGLARAVVVLTQTMERETNMDGLTLSRHWREAVAQESSSHTQRTARTTLHELAQALDDVRNRHQEAVRLAVTARFSEQPHQQIEAGGKR